ncbi:hypothetical protein O9G_005672 [Rozella allomycis CSF55]|uniref:Uncharacterized protein n=1 Tax=Rozella allomycis (strain CSF55) TaxID=988480 RepID=A0A075AWY3_ROZAC|nr:hypothetical protein O9G_005672 [Rozella allomycis CSF55]|eukprot:EPZ34629.1 hypothetical protein O9G_005672 [Rozella allomycis CSF55]
MKQLNYNFDASLKFRQVVFLKAFSQWLVVKNEVTDSQGTGQCLSPLKELASIRFDKIHNTIAIYY